MLGATGLDVGSVVGGASWAGYPFVARASTVDTGTQTFNIILDPRELI